MVENRAILEDCAIFALSLKQRWTKHAKRGIVSIESTCEVNTIEITVKEEARNEQHGTERDGTVRVGDELTFLGEINAVLERTEEEKMFFQIPIPGMDSYPDPGNPYRWSEEHKTLLNRHGKQPVWLIGQIADNPAHYTHNTPTNVSMADFAISLEEYRELVQKIVAILHVYSSTPAPELASRILNQIGIPHEKEHLALFLFVVQALSPVLERWFNEHGLKNALTLFDSDTSFLLHRPPRGTTIH